MRHASPWLMDGGGELVAPSHVIAELKQIDPRLGLQYHKTLHAFMLTEKWRENDERHAMIQRGDMAPGTDFDILAPVPADVSLDELRGWLGMQLRRVGQSREDIREMVEADQRRIQAQNEAAAEANATAAREELLSSIGSKTIDVGKRRTRVK